MHEPGDAIVGRVADARSNRAQITIAIDQELGVPISGGCLRQYSRFDRAGLA
ncbi:MAG: hypothetical protein ABIP49_08275 [Lysobacterales bacterium]